jgi:hypothetical protein
MQIYCCRSTVLRFMKVLKLYRNVARQMPIILQIYNIQVFNHTLCCHLLLTFISVNCTPHLFSARTYSPPPPPPASHCLAQLSQHCSFLRSNFIELLTSLSPTSCSSPGHLSSGSDEEFEGALGEERSCHRCPLYARLLPPPPPFNSPRHFSQTRT